MKRRIGKKLNKEEVLKMRNFNKLVYYTFSIRSYWSLTVDNVCYVRTTDGRVMIYSKTVNDKIVKGKGYYMWHKYDLL